MAFGDVVGTPATGTNTSGEASVTFSAATAGNLLVFQVNRSAVTAVTGAWGNISGWTNGPTSPPTSGNLGCAVWWKIAAGGETSVTTASTDETGNWTASVTEYAGPFAVSPLDQSTDDETHISSTATSQASGTTGTTAQAAELLIACFAIDGGNNFGTRQYSNSFTEASAVTSGGRAGGCQAKRVVSATGTYSTTLSYSSGGSADEMYGCILTFKQDTGDPPDAPTWDTADDSVFATSTPSLDFTAVDPDADDMTVQVEIANNANFDAAGVNLTDSNARSSDATLHPNPHASATSPTSGNIQVDDRPSCTFLARGGILDSIVIPMVRDEADTDGTAYLRVYAVSGSHPNYQPLGANTGDGGVNTPTAGWLAISDGIPLDSSMSTSILGYTFEFSGANRIQLEAGTIYMLSVDWVPVNRTTSNTIEIVWDTGLNDADGNAWIDGQSANYGVRADFDGDFEIYELQTLSTFTSGVDSGFSNLDNGGDTSPFTSGDALRYTVQSALDDGEWYARVRAKDDAGSGGYGDWSDTLHFTVDTSGGGSGALLRQMLQMNQFSGGSIH